MFCFFVYLGWNINCLLLAVPHYEFIAAANQQDFINKPKFKCICCSL